MWAYTSFVVLSLNLQSRTASFLLGALFSPLSPPSVSSPSSTLNRIKVAGEKQVGINRVEESRAPSKIRRRLSPFLLSPALRWERKRDSEKNEEKVYAFFRCFRFFARSRRAAAERMTEERRNEAMQHGECNATHRCSIPLFITSFLPRMLYFSLRLSPMQSFSY